MRKPHPHDRTPRPDRTVRHGRTPSTPAARPRPTGLRLTATVSALVAATLAVGSLTAGPGHASAPAPQSPARTRPGHAENHSPWVLVANPTAQRVDVAGPSTGRVTGSLTGVKLGTHSGTIQLGHGRVAFMDESKPQLDVVRIDDAGRPTIEQHFAVPSLAGDWERAGWLTTDTSRRYVAIGSDFDGSTTQQVTLVDLRMRTSRTVKVPVSQVATPSGTGTEEMEVFLVGSPLRLVVSAGGHLDSYLFSAAWRAGQSASTPRPAGSTPLSGYPHGPIVNSAGTVIGSTVAVGVQTVRVDRRGFGPATFSLYPQASEQSFRPVMAPDGTTAAGTQSGATAAGTAADRKPALLTTSSTRSSAIASISLGTGSFTRAVATRDYAAAVVSDGDGDRLVTVRRSPATGLFNGSRKVVSLSRDAATTPRFLTGAPDGRILFLGSSGSMAVTVLQPGARRATASQIELPAALQDDLYMTTVSPDSRPYDLMGR